MADITMNRDDERRLTQRRGSSPPSHEGSLQHEPPHDPLSNDRDLTHAMLEENYETPGGHSRWQDEGGESAESAC